MSNPSRLPAKNVEHRSFSEPIVLRGGIDQETSKFTVAPGTLADCLNYEAGPDGYSKMMAFRAYDGTYDQDVNNLLYVGVTDLESTYTGTTTGFKPGGPITWENATTEEDAGSGTIVYFLRQSGTSPAYTVIGINNIEGDLPVAGVTLTDGTTGATLELDGSLTHPPVELIDAINPFTDNPVGDTVEGFHGFLRSANYDLSNQSGVTTAAPYNIYHASVPGWGRILGGWQYNDEAYVVRNGHVVQFDAGGAGNGMPIYPGQIVKIPRSNFAGTQWEFARVVRVIKSSGQWEDGTAVGYLLTIPSYGDDGTDTADSYRTANYGAVQASTLEDNSNIYDKTHTTILATVYESKLVGITGHLYPMGGLVWRATYQGWEFVNTGWSVPFHTGSTAPSVANAPLFQNDLVAAATSTGALLATGSTDTASPYSFTDWVNMANITADDGAYTTCNLPAGWTSEKLLVAFTTTMLPEDDITITGVKVTVQAYQTLTGTPHDADVRLVFSDRQSENRGSRTPLSGTVLNYEFGGENDLWGLDSLTVADFNSADFKVALQYQNPTANAGVVQIDFVSIEVFYVPTQQRAYFYDPATAADLCYGYITAYQQVSGDFATDTAAGIMTFRIPEDDTTSTEEDLQYVMGGVQLRTAASGGGDLIAILDGSPEYNLLPDSAEMDAAESFYQTIRANFFENDATEAIYGVTGAGPAFSYSDQGFFFIRTPMTLAVDVPRHIAFHENRLALGFGPGFVALSAVGVPNDFSGITGANPSLWGVGDRLTGLVSVPGSVLCVFSESSIRTLEGSGEEDGTMRVISANSGAKEYTVALIGEPVFADNRGITSLSVTDKYGDFSLGRLTDRIRSWIQKRVQALPSITTPVVGPVIAIPVRNKNQYRLFFADGYGLTLYFSQDGGVEPTLFHYETVVGTADVSATPSSTRYVPTWADSSVLSSGRERLIIGTADGEVFVLDGCRNPISAGSTTNYESLPGWFILNPLNVHGGDSLGKAVYPILQGRHWGYLPVNSWADGNYYFDKSYSATADSQTPVGDPDDPTILTPKPFIMRPYLSTLTDGLVIKIGTNQTSAFPSGATDGRDRLPPHTFQSLILRTTSKGSNRTNAPQEY